MQYYDLEQGTAEWHAWRKSGIGASESPAILGYSPWMTPYRLWELKMELVEPDLPNEHMLRGIEYEDEARSKYVGVTGNLVKPMCARSTEYDWMLASYDGLSHMDRIHVEIKVPSRANFEKQRDLPVPKIYQYQIQHQLIVNGYDKAHYFVYEPETRDWYLKTVERNLDQQGEILEACDLFWNEYYLKKTFPEDLLSGSEALPSMDAELELVSAIRDWKDCKAALQDAKLAEEKAKEAVMKHRGDRGFTADGVTIFVASRKGSLDEKALADFLIMHGRDLEEFRKPSTNFWTMRQAAQKGPEL